MDKKIIYINGRFLTHKMTGIPRFAYEMCRAMYRNGMNIMVVAPESMKGENEFPFPVTYYGKKKSHAWEQWDLYCFMRKKSGALLISFSGLGPICYKPHIPTIHDLSFWENPQWFSFSYNLFYRIFTPWIARKAQRVITVSRFSQKEIAKDLEIPVEKIFVVPNAVAPQLQSDAKINEIFRAQSSEKYILMVASRDPRKNVARAVEAFLSLHLNDVKLYLIGDEGTVFKNTPLPLNDPSLRFLGRISDEELKRYYRQAMFFLYPSLYEGFGIPPLEAMANGCPILAADIEPLREVCGSAVEYCNPYETLSIVEGIRRMIENPELRNALIRKGYEQEKLYSWDLSVQKLKENLPE